MKAAQKYLFTALGVLFVAIMLFPIYWMVKQSLQPGVGPTNSLLPINPSLDAYGEALVTQRTSLLTSLVIALGCVLVTLVVALPSAYALAKFRIPGVPVMLAIIVISQMIPGIVIANAAYGIYVDIGLLNSVPGLILADATLSIPFAILILRAFIISIPDALLEAARIDGAGQFRTLVSIVTPLSRNAVVTASLFSFLFAWSDFLFALTLTTSDQVRPITLSIYDYLSSQIQDWAPVLATSVLSALPAIILLIIAQRYVSAGALGGAVK